MNAFEARALPMRIAQRRADSESEKRDPQQERDEFQPLEIHDALSNDLMLYLASLAGRIKRQSKRK